MQNLGRLHVEEHQPAQDRQAYANLADLPKRAVLITEAINGARAIMDEQGALLNDPTFLSLVKLRSGQPVSSVVQCGAPNAPSVRSILPGLSTTTAETVLLLNRFTS